MSGAAQEVTPLQRTGRPHAPHVRLLGTSPGVWGEDEEGSYKGKWEPSFFLGPCRSQITHFYPGGVPEQLPTFSSLCPRGQPARSTLWGRRTVGNSGGEQRICPLSFFFPYKHPFSEQQELFSGKGFMRQRNPRPLSITDPSSSSSLGTARSSLSPLCRRSLAPLPSGYR